MTWFLLTLVLAILGAVAFGISRIKYRDDGGEMARLTPALWALPILGGLWLLITALATIHQVPAGSVGVVYQFGDIVGQTGAGLQVLPPWQSITEASVQVQRSRFENLTAFSKETQDVTFQMSLNYSVSPDAIQSLYRRVGPGWLNVLVEPRVHNFLKETTVQYESVNIAPHREELRKAVLVRLTEDLKPYSITVHDLLIDNLDFKPEFKHAIELKQIATQDALKAQEVVKQRENEAKQAVAAAQGEADANRIRAQGQADANRLLSASLDDRVIQFQALQKLGDNIQIAIIPSGQGIILDPATLLGQRRP